MGAGSKRRTAFFVKHPTCCFCGGVKKAETEDHFPSRAIFKDRIWPEGYVFPACKECNDATAKHELIIAMLSQLYPDSAERTHQLQVMALMKSVDNNFPGLLQSMGRMTANRKRRWLRERGLSLSPGTTTADLGVMSIEDSRIQQAARLFATKLFLALYYYQTGIILRQAGGVVFRWETNAKDLDQAFPRDVLAPLLQGMPELRRANTNLKDQFFYRFAVADTKNAAAFLAFFNQSLAMLGFVFSDVASVRVPEGATVLRPFVHANGA